MREALRALGSNKIRSALTMLGVIIGIFSVITLVTIGEAAKVYVVDQVKSLGTGYDSFVVVAGKDHNSPPNPKFVYSDIRYLKSRIPEIKDVVAFTPGSGDMYYYRKKYKAPLILGVSANMVDLMGDKVAEGRFFTESEVESKRKTAVIGPNIAREVFGGISPLGEKIKIKGNSYVVVGVLSPKGSVGPFDMDKRIVIPVTTAQNMMGTNYIMRMNIFVRDVAKIDEVKEKVRELLIRRLKNDDFMFSTQQGLLSMLNNILSVLTGFVSGIAAISLIVGGIGIMNIMLVAVNERVREIGIRKAVGAKNIDIIKQFLLEAVLISLIGGVLGIIAGMLGAFFIIKAINGTYIVSLWSIVLAVIVSAAVGIFFGVYPARRAAMLDPVIALRYE